MAVLFRFSVEYVISVAAQITGYFEKLDKRLMGYVAAMVFKHRVI